MAVRLSCCTSMLGITACGKAPTPPAGLSVIYRNDFELPVGSRLPEWSSTSITFHKTITGESGSAPAGDVAVVESPDGRRRFLGEFGGPAIGRPGEPDWNHTRVDQTVRLSLGSLKPHTRVELDFDLYVLKSWDGNSPTYGPDRFMLRVAGGPVLLQTTFSNNPKIAEDASDQCYPAAIGQGAHNPPRTGAVSTGTLGYGNFFKDGEYHLSFAFRSTTPNLTLEFSSSLFEGKGTADESWGLDNVVVRADVAN
jgi:hypothetical protein